MARRKTTHYTYNARNDVDKFDLATLNKSNVVNQILVMKIEDISTESIMELFGEFNGSSLVHHYDTFDVPVGKFQFINSKGKLVSNKNKFTTTFGIWVMNIFLFNGLNMTDILNGYINDNLDAKKFGKIHQKIVYALIEDRISVDQYKTFIEYVDFIMPWESVLAPAQTELLLSCSKEINKKKAKLIADNKEAVEKGDTFVVEKIENELIDFAKEYLKDDPSLDAYLCGAGGTFENNFKNTYIMKGIVRDPDPNAKQEYTAVTSSYIDGISPDEYSTMANSLVGGPYSRAKKTELGGYWEKLVDTALSYVTLDGKDTDCGTDKYIEVLLTPDIVDAFMYSYIIKSNGSLEELNTTNVDKYINKKLKFRSTLFCKSKSGVCHHCAGNFFYRRGGVNLGLACSQIPDKLKLTSMKSFHDSTISTVTIDPMRAFLGKKS
jgi:hypothetical protein